MSTSSFYLAFLIGLRSSIPAIVSSSTVLKGLVVTTGARVVMNCSVTGSETTAWTYTAWNTSTKSEIYLGYVIFAGKCSRCKIDKNASGQHNLIVESVDLAHAGRYQCTTDFQKKLWSDIQLTVLGSVPVCGANTTKAHVKGNHQMHITTWCRISYTGHAIPVFTWTKSNVETNIAAKTTASDASEGPLISTSSAMVQLHSNDSGVIFQCRITFPMPGHSERDYAYTWNYTFTVFYPPATSGTTQGNDVTSVSYDIAVCNKNTVGFALIAATLIVFGIILAGIGLKLRKLSIAFVAGQASEIKPSFQLQESSKRFQSPSPTDDDIELQRVDETDNYCSLADQSAVAEQPQVYCELRPIDKRGNKQSTK